MLGTGASPTYRVNKIGILPSLSAINSPRQFDKDCDMKRCRLLDLDIGTVNIAGLFVLFSWFRLSLLYF